MKILVRIGDPMWPPDSAEEVWFDSKRPEESVDILGRWFCHQPFLKPELLRVGATITDGLNMYEILDVKGPLFDVQEHFIRRFHNEDEGEASAIKVLFRIQLPFLGWVYLFDYGFLNKPKYMVRTEQGVFDFLTKP